MYPTIDEVEAADQETLCRWQRFLPSPGAACIPSGKRRMTTAQSLAFNAALEREAKVMDRIVERVKAGGGFTLEISKLLGWGDDR